MEEKRCFRCLKTENSVRLLDAIYGKEVANICEQCALAEDIPIIRRPSSFQLKESERPYTVFERLSKMSGVPNKKIPQQFAEKFQTVTLDHLRKPKDYSEVLKQREERAKKKNQPMGLVDNYHWHIQKTRRDKKMSLAQLGGIIGESESTLKMIEDGILPDDADRVINKIEQYLQIRLRKGAQATPQVQHITEAKQEIKAPARVLSYSKDRLNALTISDLQKMKQDKSRYDQEEADKDVASKLIWQGRTKGEREIELKKEQELKQEEVKKTEEAAVTAANVNGESKEERKSRKSFWDIFKRKKDVDKEEINELIQKNESQP